jgi:hypothetical protein
LNLLDYRLLSVGLAQTEELAQFGTNDEERTRRHGAGDLKEEESGTRVGVCVCRLLECDYERDELRNSQSGEQSAGEGTH